MATMNLTNQEKEALIKAMQHKAFEDYKNEMKAQAEQNAGFGSYQPKQTARLCLPDLLWKDKLPFDDMFLRECFAEKITDKDAENLSRCPSERGEMSFPIG